MTDKNTEKHTEQESFVAPTYSEAVGYHLWALVGTSIYGLIFGVVTGAILGLLFNYGVASYLGLEPVSLTESACILSLASLFFLYLRALRWA